MGILLLLAIWTEYGAVKTVYVKFTLNNLLITYKLGCPIFLVLNSNYGRPKLSPFFM